MIHTLTGPAFAAIMALMALAFDKWTWAAAIIVAVIIAANWH